MPRPVETTLGETRRFRDHPVVTDRILHILDRTCDPTVFQRLATLTARADTTHSEHIVCTIHGPTAVEAARFLRTPIHRAESRWGRWFAYAPALGAIIRRVLPRTVHAWGAEAVAACASSAPGRPMALTCLDPADTADVGRRLRALPPGAAVVAGSQVVRARLIAEGMDPARTVVIRGPVDFKAINEARAAGVRQRVVADARPVALLSGPPSRAGGQYFGLWAAAIVKQVIPGLRVMMPYASAEADRLSGFVRDIGLEDMLIVPPPESTWPELLACADVFLAPAADEVCVEPLGWAMAAGVPIVGTAVRSVAELIADRSNGLLCKPREPRALAAKLLAALEDADLCRRIAEVARGQAYEVFSVRAFADNYRRVFDNLAAGRPIADGVQDTAMVA